MTFYHHRVILLSFIQCLQCIIDATDKENSATTSDKPVKIDLHGNTGSIWLDRVFQVITVLLLMVVLVIFIITMVSIAWFCCIDSPRRRLSKHPYDSISTTPLKEENEHELKA